MVPDLCSLLPTQISAATGACTDAAAPASGAPTFMQLLLQPLLTAPPPTGTTDTSTADVHDTADSATIEPAADAFLASFLLMPAPSPAPELSVDVSSDLQPTPVKDAALQMALPIESAAAPDDLAAVERLQALPLPEDFFSGDLQPAPSGNAADSSVTGLTGATPPAAIVRTMGTLLPEAASPMPRHLSAAPGSPAWTEELGERLTWMAHRGVDSASLRLSPEHLGPLEIRISVQDGQTSVWFGASHPETRAALEQSLPRLRELLAAQGMTLADASVSREAPRERPAAPVASTFQPADQSDSTSVTVTRVTGIGLLDTYA